MNRIKHLIRLCVLTAVLAASASLVASCSLVDKNEGELIDFPVDESDWFQIRFRICTRNVDATRAADIVGEEEGSAAENILNLKDMRYYLFDKDGNFLTDLTPGIDHERTMAITKDYSLYEVVAKINDEQTDYFKNNRYGTVDFFLMAIANYSRDSGYGDVALPAFTTGNTISQMFQTPFTPVINHLPETGKLMKAAAESDPAKRSCIPMSGLQRFTLSGTWFETQAGEVPTDISYITGKDLNMLRAAAKIEIIDRINMKTEDKYNEATDGKKIRIKSAALNGVMKTARIIPMQNQWERNSTFETQQVENPSVTGADKYMLPPALAADGSISAGSAETDEAYSLAFVYDEVETMKRADRCPVYSCYVWEYLKTDGIPENQLPYLSVTVSNPEDIDPEDIPQDVAVAPTTTYNMRLLTDMTPTAQDPKPQESILRNHIYRYEISGAGTTMTIKWTVCPMTKLSADIIFN